MAKWTNRDAKLQFGITENLSIERQIHVQYMPKCINKSNIIKFCNATCSCIRIWMHSLQILKLLYVFLHCQMCTTAAATAKTTSKKNAMTSGCSVFKMNSRIFDEMRFSHCIPLSISRSESLCVCIGCKDRERFETKSVISLRLSLSLNDGRDTQSCTRQYNYR